MSARVTVAAVAVAVLAWLGVVERGVRLQAGVPGAAAAGDLAGAEADLRAARFLNPDAGPDLRRAVLYQGSGREAEAVALLEAVLRREPDNLPAWGLLRTFAGQRDPAAARRALEARRRLDPQGARAG